MAWNMAPECISCVILSIIWIYSRKGNPIPSLRNRLFQACLSITFCAMITNILSALLLAALVSQTLVLAWLANMAYFLTTPLMGMVYFYYTLANLYDGAGNQRQRFLLSALPGLVYVGLVLSNPFTRVIFDITMETGYHQGPLIGITYWVFFLYCIASLVVTVVRGRKVSPAIQKILLSFPLIAVLVIFIQIQMPDVVLTGTAATCAILLIYLYLQNKQLSIDHLTNIPNRQEFLSMLELNLKRGTPFSVMVLSLREFKAVNDTHGQLIGDELLKALGEFLRRSLDLRENELYRYSGDEFAIVLRAGAATTEQRLLDSIHQRLAQPWQVQEHTCLLEGAIGIVSCPETAADSATLIRGIECAVSVAKRSGENRHVCRCTAKLLEQAKRRQTIAEILRQSMKQGGFQVYYQPIWSVQTGQFPLAEALLRLNDTPLGPISPAEFIPIAEETGLIVDMTYWVLEQVCRDLRHILDLGLPLQGISVNFSALQFTQRDLVARVLEILQAHGVPTSFLKVEITEGALAENDQVTADFIHRMHQHDVRVGLDDFGTGYSNLASVIELPLDTVKLDKSLVWSAIKKENYSIVLQNVARAFRELGFTVLAEGVENEEQSQFVQHCGCTLIQGFHYARPMPMADFLALLERTTQVQ